MPIARGELARVGRDAIHVVVAVQRVVVEQHEAAHAGFARDVHRVLDRAVTPVPLRLVLLERVLRVVDEQVDAVAQLEHAGRDVVVGVGRRPCPDRDRGGTRPTCRSTRRGSRASAPTWRTQRERTLASPTGKSSSPVSWKRMSPGRSVGPDREERRAHHLREHLAERAVGLARPVDVERRARPVQRHEERQALHVIPVQVRQERGAVERRPRPSSRTDAGRCRGRRGSAAGPSPRARRTTSGRRSARTRARCTGVEPRTPKNVTVMPPDTGRRILNDNPRDNSSPRADVATASRRSAQCTHRRRIGRMAIDAQPAGTDRTPDATATASYARSGSPRSSPGAAARCARSTASTSPCTRARSSACSARTARARPRRSACSRPG